jgi:peptide/nickel transport system ATP-binding protein
MPALLQVRDLSVRFAGQDTVTHAVDSISFELAAGEILGLVGESGCGKSVTALAMLGLLPARAAQRSGAVMFDGRELLGMGEPELQTLRGNRIAMIFQEPMTSLNPVLTIGHQIAEAVRIHRRASAHEARAAARSILTRVRMPDANSRLDDYPHQLSGGQRQRVMIAMALICKPALLIADEPTTALDVTIQAQILDLMRDLQAETKTAVLLITHDLGVVAEMCNRVAVMYAGRIVEQAPVAALFQRPAHPYTQGLLRAAARGRGGARLARLHDIPGQVPSLHEPSAGCAFAPRCSFADAACRVTRPVMEPVAGQLDHTAACLRLEQVLA